MCRSKRRRNLATINLGILICHVRNSGKSQLFLYVSRDLHHAGIRLAAMCIFVSLPRKSTVRPAAVTHIHSSCGRSRVVVRFGNFFFLPLEMYCAVPMAMLLAAFGWPELQHGHHLSILLCFITKKVGDGPPRKLFFPSRTTMSPRGATRTSRLVFWVRHIQFFW